MNTNVDSVDSASTCKSAIDATTKVSAVERTCIVALMPLLFSSVFGRRGAERLEAPGSAQRFDVDGIDGSRLSSILVCSNATAPKGVVLLCHPFLKYGMAYFFKHRYLSWINAAGYHVVAFNFKGFGSSTLGGIAFADDVLSVKRWIDTAYPDLPVHLFGTSFGGYHGIHGIARHRLKFASVVLDSVPAQITRFFGHGAVGFVMRWLSRSRWGHPTGTAPLAESYPALRQTPCLFLYGDNDRFISPIELTELRQLCSDATINSYPDCDHLGIRKRYGERYISDITAFIDSHAHRSETTTATRKDSTQ